MAGMVRGSQANFVLGWGGEMGATALLALPLDLVLIGKNEIEGDRRGKEPRALHHIFLCWWLGQTEERNKQRTVAAQVFITWMTAVIQQTRVAI